MITFDDALRERLAANLARHERRACDLDGRRHAAVAITLVDLMPSKTRRARLTTIARSLKLGRLRFEVEASGGTPTMRANLLRQWHSVCGAVAHGANSVAHHTEA